MGMEQQLINALMKLAAKAGAGFLIRDVVQFVDENGNPKIWDPSEIAKAVYLVNWQADHFKKTEAIMVIQSLLKKFDLQFDEVIPNNQHPNESIGVQGLQ